MHGIWTETRPKSSKNPNIPKNRKLFKKKLVYNQDIPINSRKVERKKKLQNACRANL